MSDLFDTVHMADLRMDLADMSFPMFFDDDLPSCINSAICPISVFDKFDDWGGWDHGEMDDMMMNGAHDSDVSDSLLLNDKNDSDHLASFFSFPDLLDDKCPPLADPIKSEPVYNAEFDPKLDIKEESLTADDLEATLASSLLSVPPFDEIKIETLDEAIEVVKSAAAAPATSTATVSSSVTTAASSSSILSAPIVISTQPTATLTSTTLTGPTFSSGSLIRIPVRRSANGSVEPNFSKSGTSRPVKAVVVCPPNSRTKSILCNVVRSTPKGIVIQKPRSLIHTTLATAASTSTLSSIAKSDATKIPVMAVNVISSKEFKSRMAAAAAAAAVNDEIKIEPTLAALNGADAIKIEYEEARPLTPMSQKSDEESRAFLSPASCKNLKAVDFFSETFMKSPCMLDDDNFNSDSYKCLPPAVVTGQVQPTIPDVFKYTPNSSPTNNTSEMYLTNDSVDSFFSGSSSPLDVGIISQGSSSGSSGSSMFFNKAAINVDHDYGFTCRTPKTSSSLFSTDSLGIQTPSASEPPTDSDEDDKNLDDFGLLNDDFDSSEMERELEALKDEIRLAEHDSSQESRKSSKSAASGHSRSGASSAKKSSSRNRKRKVATKERSSAQPHTTAVTLVNRPSTVFDPAARFATAMTTTGNLKIRLPTKTASTSTSTAPPAKRRKTGSGGRIFSPSERHLHNTNEQVRRIEMRQSFEELRQLVPSLIDKPKAPKVLILQEAKAYCDELFHSELRLSNQTVALTCQQDRLKNTLTGLRKYCSDNVWSAVQKMF